MNEMGTVKQNSPIEDSLLRLSDKLDQMTEEMEVLKNRLSPILSDAEPKEDKAEGTKAEIVRTSSMELRLKEFWHKADRIHNMIESCHGRLRL